MVERKCGTCKFLSKDTLGFCLAPVPVSVDQFRKSRVSSFSGTECLVWQERPRMTLGEAYRRACGFKDEGALPPWAQLTKEDRGSYERRAIESMKHHASMLRIYRDHNGEDYNPNS
jgi:hypothetical protein